jgi:hypothetical protein
MGRDAEFTVTTALSNDLLCFFLLLEPLVKA